MTENNNPSLSSSKTKQTEQDYEQADNVNGLTNYTLDENGIVTNYFETLDTVYKEDKNYTIYTDGFSFRYTINDNKGNVLDIGYHDYRGSFNLYYQGNLLVLDYGFGGNTRPSYRYYDVENGRVSSFYSNPLAVSDTKVAYFIYREQDGEEVLIVQDIPF